MHLLHRKLVWTAIGQRLSGRFIVLAGIFSSIALATACTTPGERFARIAGQQGLATVEFEVSRHTLTAHYAAGDHRASDRLHVYLSGDGTPWAGGRYPALDPSPRRSLILELMALDPAARLLLNRPCYGHGRMPPQCHPALWTSARYSEEVVAAMDEALDQARVAFASEHIVLIGYSGGGTLAWLLAQRRDDVVGVMTVAANLDHRQWTAHHGYLPLTESLDPTELSPLRQRIRQWHLVGGRDADVPEAVTRAVAGRVRRYPDFDHRCCWVAIWPEMLSELATELP
ncbi:MAG: hypothetical protein WED00_15865 [Aquisalimonadaceae bacterium]